MGLNTTSWRSNLFFLSLLTFFIFGGFVNATAAGSEVINNDSPAKPEGVVGIVKRLIKVAINGQDAISFIKRDTEDGITRLTDDNYVDLVEHPLVQGLDDEVWVVLVHGRLTDPSTDVVLEYHKNASDLIKKDLELSNYKFARLDYLSSWKTCTKWLLMKPPTLVIISEKGKNIRFIPLPSLGKEPENLYKVLKDKMYEVILPWNTKWSPNGDRAYLIEYYITTQEKITKLTHGIPNWMILGLTGIISQQVMSWLHSSNPSNSTKKVVRQEKITIKEDKKVN
ncbi:uncharacterized protein I206_100864 [Kwoniella pini CBS 10737]|uniref:Thioredoxin domain-containing protein n=1 Tax=Kwoniella pini CBS 10737 TaxID=1296096 RepID=A0A1B9ICN6_9TREE|nr:uncharacterized protein I206_00462 [Kwoniella pini CBS 10737]OCF53161.1 hypothetical protein I206_00462 [Kwoniella pini CBS 10737]